MKLMQSMKDRAAGLIGQDTIMHQSNNDNLDLEQVVPSLIKYPDNLSELSNEVLPPISSTTTSES